MSIIDKAMEMATFAHEGQTRKYTGDDYISHPLSVVSLVSSVRHTGEMIAAAWLHDVVEDTNITLDMIREQISPAVADLVEQLTDVSKKTDGNRVIRKEIDRQHLAKASPSAKTIKLADIIDNVPSIKKHDPGFARKYVEEKRALLEVLKEGDPWLYAKAKLILEVK